MQPLDIRQKWISKNFTKVNEIFPSLFPLGNFTHVKWRSLVYEIICLIWLECSGNVKNDKQQTRVAHPRITHCPLDKFSSLPVFSHSLFHCFRLPYKSPITSKMQFFQFYISYFWRKLYLLFIYITIKFICMRLYTLHVHVLRLPKTRLYP